MFQTINHQASQNQGNQGNHKNHGSDGRWINLVYDNR